MLFLVFRALNLGLLSQDQVDSCDPALMFTIPRLAIVSGLLIFPDGPLCLDRGDLSDMFHPFRSLLLKIRELLWTLNRGELGALERALCSVDDTFIDPSPTELAEDSSTSTNNKHSHHNQHNGLLALPPPSSGQPNNSTATRNQHNSSSHHHHHHNNSQLNHHAHHHHIHRHHHHHTHHHLVHSSSTGGTGEDQEAGEETDNEGARPSDPLPIASHAIQDYLDQFYKDFPQCKDFISDLCHSTNNNSSATTTPTTMTMMTTSLDQEDATLAIDNVDIKASSHHNLPMTDNMNHDDREPEIGSMSDSSTHSLQYSSLESESPDDDPEEPKETMEVESDRKQQIEPQSSSPGGSSPSSSSAFKSIPDDEEYAITKDDLETEENKFPQKDEVVHFDETDMKNCDGGVAFPPRPTSLDITGSPEARKSFHYEGEDIPTPLVEIKKQQRVEDEDDGLLEESKPASHSSSSSRDSGLSSMAEKQHLEEAPSSSPTSSSVSRKGVNGIQFEIQSDVRDESRPGQVDQEVPPPQNSSRGGGGGGPCQLMTVVMNANRIRTGPTPTSVMMNQPQDLSLCSGSCCNSECSGSASLG
jgi:hypothetical protein